jgi:thymidylate synthase (FAD)
MIIVEPKAQVIKIDAGPLEAIEFAARTAYKSQAVQGNYEKTLAFVTNLVNKGHHSPLEFADMTVRFTTDRGIANELVRHRLSSFCQESTRYVKYDDGNMEFIKPSGLTLWSDEYRLWEESCTLAEAYYIRLIKAGCTAQVARSVLPSSLKTELVMKANLREWRHVIGLRLDRAAHPDMRHLMALLIEELTALPMNQGGDWIKILCLD